MAESRANPNRKRREVFGTLRRLPSGRYQASYLGPDKVRHNAPSTFGDEDTARAWLRREQSTLALGSWESPRDVYLKHQRASTRFGAFADQYVATRYSADGKPLRPNTVTTYRRLLDGPLAPFRDRRIAQITRGDVADWRAGMLATGKRTTTAMAYTLLKAVMNEAVERDLIVQNPCRIRGGSSTTTGKAVIPPTPSELRIMADAISPRYRALLLVCAWGGLRFGEATELRRRDIEITRDGGVVEQIEIAVTRAVTHTPTHGRQVGPTKTKAGVRRVILPPLMYDDLIGHLDEWTDPFGDSLVFPSPTNPALHLAASTLAADWEKARAAAGREDMPWHALRHFAATRYAETGATTADLMDRMGHHSAADTMRYQHPTGRQGDLVRMMKA